MHPVLAPMSLGCDDAFDLYAEKPIPNGQWSASTRAQPYADWREGAAADRCGPWQPRRYDYEYRRNGTMNRPSLTPMVR